MCKIWVRVEITWLQFLIHQRGSRTTKSPHGSERLFTVIPDSWARRKDWLEYFSCLKTVLPPLNMCRFWSDDEISLFEENILKLSKVIQKSFPHRSITIKAHYLLVHTITFIKRFRSYGLFNEQALENLHQIMFRNEV